MDKLQISKIMDDIVRRRGGQCIPKPSNDDAPSSDSRRPSPAQDDPSSPCEVLDAVDLGFVARNLVQASLPYRAISGNVFRRVNGNLEVCIVSPLGLPYGGIPRLILAWITTEAVRTHSPHLLLGHSMNAFMRWLGLHRTGGSRGDITRMRMQMERLITSTITCRFSDTTNSKGGNLLVAQKYDLWWSEGVSDENDDDSSWIHLSQDFYDEIVKYPVPLNLSVFKALKSSPLAMDIYSWLSYRQHYLDQPVVIRWPTLMLQFGSSCQNSPSGQNNFRLYFLRQLKDVLPHITRVQVEADTRHLKLMPVASSVPASVASGRSTTSAGSHAGTPSLPAHSPLPTVSLPPPPPSPPPDNTDTSSSLRLRTSTYETAKKIAPGYDIYVLEYEWRQWMETKPNRPADPDRAFLGFVRKRAQKKTA